MDIIRKIVLFIIENDRQFLEYRRNILRQSARTIHYVHMNRWTGFMDSVCGGLRVLWKER